MELVSFDFHHIVPSDEVFNENIACLEWCKQAERASISPIDFIGMEDRTTAHSSDYCDDEWNEGNVVYWLHGTAFRTNDLFHVNLPS